jgi:hypothetical protein
MVSTLLVVEYMAPDGELHTESEAYDSAGQELDLATTLELLEYAKAKAVAPMLAQQVARFCMEDNDGD